MAVIPSNRFRSDGKTTCSRCGKGTYSSKGVCRECHNGASLPDPSRLTTSMLVSYRDLIEAELTRRVEELQAALARRAVPPAHPSPAQGPEGVLAAVPGPSSETERSAA